MFLNCPIFFLGGGVVIGQITGKEEQVNCSRDNYFSVYFFLISPQASDLKNITSKGKIGASFSVKDNASLAVDLLQTLLGDSSASRGTFTIISLRTKGYLLAKEKLKEL